MMTQTFVLPLALLALAAVARCQTGKCNANVKVVPKVDLCKSINIPWTIGAIGTSSPVNVTSAEVLLVAENDKMTKGTVTFTYKQSSGETTKEEYVWKKSNVSGEFQMRKKGANCKNNGDKQNPADRYTTTIAVFQPDTGLATVRCYEQSSEPMVIVATKDPEASRKTLDKLIAAAKKNGVNVDNIKYINGDEDCDHD